MTHSHLAVRSQVPGITSGLLLMKSACPRRMVGYGQPTQEGTEPQLSESLSENLDTQLGMGRWAREAVLVALPFDHPWAHSPG